MDNSIKPFIKGMLFGAALGATLGILFAPKSGKETREDILKKAEELKQGAVDLYAKAKASLERKVTELKKLNKKIDKDVYEKLIQDVIGELKNNKEITSEAGKKLGAQLKEDWNDVKNALMA